MANLQIFVQGEGKREILLLELPPQTTVREFIDLARARGLASEHGGQRAEHSVSVYLEDAAAPMPVNATLETAGLVNQGSVHVSRCARVAATVHFNGSHRSETFGPGVPMHRVKEWAVGKKGFDLNPVDAAEHLLQITGTSDRPDEDVHIGSLVGADGCRVEFDLVAKVRVEG